MPRPVGRGPVPRRANRLKQDFQDFQDFTGLGLWCIGAVVACHGVFDASDSIILPNRDTLVNPAPNRENRVNPAPNRENPAQNPAHIFLI